MPNRLTPGKIENLKALTNDRGVIAAAAMDQRGSLKKAIGAAKGIDRGDVTDEMMTEFKVAVSKVLTPHASAIPGRGRYRQLLRSTTSCSRESLSNRTRVSSPAASVTRTPWSARVWAIEVSA